MIYTVTFNPSIDYILRMKEITIGTVNRTISEEMYPGGKGINVSIVLKNLGFENKALGFIAGFTGREIERMVTDYGIYSDFIDVQSGRSRINVKIKAGAESEINGQGPNISRQAVECLLQKLDQLKDGDYFVLAGSIPNSLPADIYEQILKRLQNRNIRIVVDATKELLLNVMKYGPFLVKPNNHELGEMFGVELKSLEDIALYAKKLQEMGGRNILVSLAGDGALLLTETGEIFHSLPPEGKVVNSVGAGDSMVAGFIAGFLEKQEYEYAFHAGLAAGSASAFQEWLAKKEDIMKLMKVTGKDV